VLEGGVLRPTGAPIDLDRPVADEVLDALAQVIGIATIANRRTPHPYGATSGLNLVRSNLVRSNLGESVRLPCHQHKGGVSRTDSSIHLLPWGQQQYD
jgi:hypothetical protein